MNRNNSDSSSSTRGELPLWQKLIVVGLVMFVLVVMGVGYVVGTDYSARRKTTTIINTIRLGLELTLGSKGEMIPLDFTYLRKHFGYLDTLAELRALQAIDESNQCFVDAWRRPLLIRLRPNQHFEVISSGPDGLPGTSDDLR